MSHVLGGLFLFGKWVMSMYIYLCYRSLVMRLAIHVFLYNNVDLGFELKKHTEQILCMHKLGKVS